MSGYPLPVAAFDDRLGAVGTSGSGKTYGLGTAVERLLDKRRRAIIVDPLGVWYGLRLLADGKTPSGYDVVIFGGPHGDLALTPHSGGLIGETVAGMKESCIVDLSQLGAKAAERRFMLAFLEALYRHASKEPVHLVMDEVDMFAPQRLLDKEGDAAKLLGMVETIVRRGRVRGFIPWLLTQRPAVVSKDVLSQVDGLAIFKLTSSQDRDAISAWVEGQADKKDWTRIYAGLAAKELGHAVVWLPGHGVLIEDAAFPAKATFDSSATPKRGEKRVAAELKPLDVGKLKDRLAKVETEAKANDPAALRAENARLRKQMEEAAKVAARSGQVPDPNAIAAAEGRGAQRGFADGYTAGAAAEWERGSGQQVQADIENVAFGVASAAQQLKDLSKKLGGRDRRPLTYKSTLSPPPAAPSNEVAKSYVGKPAALRRSAPAAPSSAIEKSNVGGPGQRILNALATWKAMGHDKPSNAQVAWLARYSPASTGYTNPRGALKSAGLVDYPSPGLVALTPDGEAQATAITIDGLLLDFVVSQLPGPETRILKAAAAIFPADGSNDEIATAASYSASSTGYTNPRGALKTKELLTYPASGRVRAAEWLFP